MVRVTFEKVDDTSNGNHVKVTRSVHELFENVDSINNVKSSDGQVNESTNHTTINIKIMEKKAILIIELQTLFHGKRSRPSNKLVTIRKDVESIFVLIEKDAFGRVGNFEAKKLLQRKIFSFEM